MGCSREEVQLEVRSDQAPGVLGGEGLLQIEPRPGAGGLGLPLDIWGLDLASRGRGPPRLHGAILCFRIRIIDFILNCRTAAGGEDGAGSGRSAAIRGVEAGGCGRVLLSSLPSDLRLPVTFRHIPGFDEGWGL